MIAIAYIVSEFGVPQSTSELMFFSVVLAIAGLLSLGATVVLLVGWKGMTRKQRIELALLALFL